MPKANLYDPAVAKNGELVKPPMKTLFKGSTFTAFAPSANVPPMNVPNDLIPEVAAYLTKNASCNPALTACCAAGTVEAILLVEVVFPTT